MMLYPLLNKILVSLHDLLSNSTIILQIKYNYVLTLN